MAADLTTTNQLLGIMTMVSIFEGVFVAAALGAVVVLCRGLLQAIRRLEEQQVSPALGRVNAILDDVKDVTATAREQAGRTARATERIARQPARTRRREIHAGV